MGQGRQALGEAMWLTQGYVARSGAQSPGFSVSCLRPPTSSSGFITVLLGDRLRKKITPRSLPFGYCCLEKKSQW